MSNIYVDLPSRIEEAFPEIDNDIVMELRSSNEAYAHIISELSTLKKAHSFIAQLSGPAQPLEFSADELKIFQKYLGLMQEKDNIERQQIYFRGHTDALAYLKKVGLL